MKPTTEVDFALLQGIVSREEKAGWTTQTAFFEHAANRYNESKRKPGYKDITGAIVGLRVKAGLITTTVEKGKRGSRAGFRSKALEGVSRKRKKPVYNSEERKEVLKYCPSKYRAELIKDLENLTPRKALKWKCIDCSGWEKAEVARCNILTCISHKLRPYKGKTGTNNEPVEEECDD